MTSLSPARRLPARILALVGVLALLLSACSRPAAVITRSDDNGGYRGAFLGQGYVMPDATLTDAHGQDFNLRSSPSKPVTLVFFGYTNCPDVCIGVLSDTALALQRVDEQTREHIQMVYITTDPARDKPKVIGAYLERFDPSFIGLTGELNEIVDVASDLGVDIQGKKKLPSGGYEIGHSAQVIGFGADRVAEVLWTPSTPIGDLSADFERLVDQQ